MAPYYKGRP